MLLAPIADVRNDLSWCAGIIDGEGYVGISANVNGPRKRPIIAVSMTHLPTMKKVVQTLGVGKLSFVKKRKPHHKDAWTWTVHYRKALFVAQLLAPLCVTKKEALDDIVKFYDEWVPPANWFQHGHKNELRYGTN